MFSQIAEVMAPEFEGKEVQLRGWVYRKRTGGKMEFVLLRDASGVIQCTVKQDKVPEQDWENANKALIESSVTVKGVVKPDTRAPGGYELQATGFDVTHFSEIFPISKDQSTEFLLDVRHLWLRSQRLTNIMKVRDYVTRYFREFFEKEGFWEVTPPILTKAGCEGGSSLFELDYFGDKAYLTQSGQLYNEVFITALEKIFIFAPSFRAEKSRTTKHLCEYWHLEMEAAYYDNEENMRFQENMVSFVCNKLADEHPDLLEFFEVNPEDLKAIKPPFPRITYDEALEILAKQGRKKETKGDFGAEDERIITEGHKTPVFVTEWPAAIKAFYMERMPDKPDRVLASDMLAPNGHGEVIGGSQRVWELDKLMEIVKKEGLSEKDYEWYIDMRKYGSVPHSGFGLGMERFVKWVLNLDHIRDAVPFPRVLNRVYP